MYKFKTTELITESLDKNGYYFEVESYDEHERICVRFSIDCGPDVRMYLFIQNNNVGLRVWGFITDIPQHKRNKVLEICNTINTDERFIRVSVDKYNDVLVAYDFPQNSNDCIGEMAVEIIRLTKSLLNRIFEMFMKALFTDEEEMKIIKEENSLLCDMGGFLLENNMRLYKRNWRMNRR